MSDQTGSPLEQLLEIDAPNTIVITIDLQGTVTGWSQAAERLLALSAASVVGTSAADLLRPAVPPFWNNSGSDSWSGQLSLRHSRGHLLPLQGHAFRLLGLGTQDQWVLVLASSAQQMSLQETDRALLKWLLTISPVAITVYDTNLRCVRHNAAMMRLTGMSEEDRRGKKLSEIVSGSDIQDWEECLRRVLRTGEPAFKSEIRGRTLADPFREKFFSAAASVLRDSQGAAIGVCTTVEDITDQGRSREHLTVLNQATTRIGSTLDVMTTAQELADIAVPRLADWGTVDLLETLLNGDEPAPFTRAVALRRVAHRAAFPVITETIHPAGSVDFYPADSPPVRCMATGRTTINRIEDADVRSWLAEDLQRAERFRTYAFQHLMAVPVQARGMTLGLALFLRRIPEPFTEDDRLLAEELVARAAVCLDNARRFTRQRATALTLQRSLLPHGVPQHTAITSATRYLPAGGSADLGGDWFDVIPLSGARVALVVGDVVGHGLGAAATMGQLRAAVRTLADVDLPPDELLTHLDDLVTNLAAETNELEAADLCGLSATCLYAVYDPVSRVCSIARAGHPPPVLVCPDGAVQVLDQATGPPLGLGYLPFEPSEVTLPEGSLLVLYTDGLFGMQADWQEQLQQLMEISAHGEPSPQALCDRVIATMLPEPGQDDVALLVARTRALTSEQVATLNVPSDPVAVSKARSWSSRQLAAWGLDDASFVTELVVTELVTNAIRYASPPIELRLIRDQTLICEVTDASNTAPHMRRARLLDEGGRGLLLVAQLTQRWGTRQSRSGKTIWCEQSIEQSSEANGWQPEKQNILSSVPSR